MGTAGTRRVTVSSLIGEVALNALLRMNVSTISHGARKQKDGGFHVLPFHENTMAD